MKRELQSHLHSFRQLMLWAIRETDWTYTDIADESGLSSQTVSRLMKGKTKSPHYRTMMQMASAFGMQIEFKKNRLKASVLRKKKAG